MVQTYGCGPVEVRVCTTCCLPQICPHYGEHVWRNILRQPGAGITAGWPEAQAPDNTLKAANKYLQVSVNVPWSEAM